VTTFAEQATRIANLLQETPSNDTVARYLMQHQDELSRLARSKYFGQITWYQAIQGQALYVLPDNIIEVCHVLYNQKVLRYVTEQTLDYSGNVRSWEANTGEPTYWTLDNQVLNEVRIIPAPMRTGSAVPSPTFLPMYQDMKDNLLVFTYEDVALEVTNVDSVIPTLLDWEDMLVFASVQALALQEYPEQNIPLAQNCAALLKLWMSYAA
jgi:hypothetical protein